MASGSEAITFPSEGVSGAPWVFVQLSGGPVQMFIAKLGRLD